MSFSFLQCSLSYLERAQKRANSLPLFSFTYLNTARASPFSFLARLPPLFQPCLILHALQQFCLHIPVKYLFFSAAVWHCWFRQPDIMRKPQVFFYMPMILPAYPILYWSRRYFSIQAGHFTFCFPNCSPFHLFRPLLQLVKIILNSHHVFQHFGNLAADLNLISMLFLSSFQSLKKTVNTVVPSRGLFSTRLPMQCCTTDSYSLYMAFQPVCTHLVPVSQAVL